LWQRWRAFSTLDPSNGMPEGDALTRVKI
jgi:hypothetical protein